MLQGFDNTKLTKLLNAVRSDIGMMFSVDVSQWIISNIMFINEYIYDIVNRVTTW